MAVLRYQRRRLGIVDREACVALTRFDARDPQQQPRLGGVGRIATLDDQLGDQERDAMWLAKPRHHASDRLRWRADRRARPVRTSARPPRARAGDADDVE